MVDVSGTTNAEVGDATVIWTYSSYEEEYETLRNGTGLLDHTATGLIEIAGDRALEFVQQVVARDVEYLVPERCMTTLLLDPGGEPRDIVTLYALASTILVETAFGTGRRTLEYLQSAAPDGVEVTDKSDEFSVVGVEGPYAWAAIGSVLGEEFTVLPFEGVAPVQVDGVSGLFSRSGYTGEYGYKVIAPRTACETLKQRLAEADAVPVGFGALETAMIEVRQPLFHRELGDGGTVLSCGWNWLMDFTKESFVGREPVLQEYEAGPDGRSVGFALDGRAEVPSGARVRAADEEIGVVVHSVWSPRLGATLGLARVSSEFAAAGLDLVVESGDGSVLKARTLTSPYVIPKSWTLPIQ